MDIPSLDDICFINRRLIEAATGRWEPPDNLLNPAPLQYALEAVSVTVAGVELPPGLVRKAASIGWAIATRHPFFDTNKRTAAETTFVVLQLNGRRVTVSSAEIVAIMLGIAEHRVSFDEWVDWLEARVV